MEIEFKDNNVAKAVYGEHQANLKIIEEELDITINARGNHLNISGERHHSQMAKKILNGLSSLISNGYPLYPGDVQHAITILKADNSVNLKDIFLDTIFITVNKRQITPKNISQKKYIDAIRKFDMVFGIGPAGTGKTYLAMAMAIAMFTKGLYSRILLVRPAVEAGERLGYLPGDLAEKVNPYLRPLYDALNDIMKFEKSSIMLDKGLIEVAPLAFMRGRTLNDSFVILDEAQNTTREQMKMFLTRLGPNSKAVITGDITQIDLPENKESGLVEAQKILSRIKGIKFINFNKKDVVRHKLVQDIIDAYEKRRTAA